MYYPDEIVEEVRQRNDIVDIVSGYVRLQKKGSSYFGLCPFHNEKSPSFSVSGQKQMYYCFGCGEGGNVITFLMKYENYSFTEALQILADRAGITLPKKEMSREARAEADLRARLLEVNKLAANYFYYQLKQPQGKVGHDYFLGRQLSEETIRHFGLGFANKYSDDLYQYLKSKGYEDAFLKETGLVTVEERGAHDKFWNRVMFPILDVNNRVIGFGGRVMGDAKPKYLNSPETKIFDKGRNLYGLNFARFSKKGYLLLCEGYMDVIAMHQAGFTNAVASLGTALTPGHANLLKRYTTQVILTYDSDGAGVRAAQRAIPILKEAGISTKVLNMEPYKDPDEFIRNLGTEAFEERIRQASNSFLWEIRILKKGYDLQDPEQQTAFQRAAAEKLADFPEALERDNYIRAVSGEQGIPYEDLRRLVNTIGSRRLLTGKSSAAPDAYASGSSAARPQSSPAAGGSRAEQSGTPQPGSAAPLNGEAEAYRWDIEIPADAGGWAEAENFPELPEDFRPDAAGQASRADSRRKKKNAAEEGPRHAQRLLLTWLIEEQGLYEKVGGLISPEDFREPLYHETARLLLADLEKGEINPARILNHFINDEDQYSLVAELFHTRLSGELSPEEKNKAITDTVIKVRRNSLEQSIRNCTDIAKLQELIQEKKDLDRIRITL